MASVDRSYIPQDCSKVNFFYKTQAIPGTFPWENLPCKDAVCKVKLTMAPILLASWSNDTVQLRLQGTLASLGSDPVNEEKNQGPYIDQAFFTLEPPAGVRIMECTHQTVIHSHEVHASTSQSSTLEASTGVNGKTSSSDTGVGGTGGIAAKITDTASVSNKNQKDEFEIIKRMQGEALLLSFKMKLCYNGHLISPYDIKQIKLLQNSKAARRTAFEIFFFICNRFWMGSLRDTLFTPPEAAKSSLTLGKSWGYEISIQNGQTVRLKCTLKTRTVFVSLDSRGVPSGHSEEDLYWIKIAHKVICILELSIINGKPVFELKCEGRQVKSYVVLTTREKPRPTIISADGFDDQQHQYDLKGKVQTLKFEDLLHKVFVELRPKQI